MLQLAQGAPEGLMNKLRTLGQIIQMGRFQPKTVNRAPCQEVVLQGAEVDLFKFPIIRCWPMDGGRYITLPLVITKDPVTGTQNYGMYRMQVFDRCTTGMHWQTHKVGAHHYRVSQERQDNRLEVAVAIGADPATMWTGSAPLPPDMDEMAVAGFIREEGVELVKAKSVDLLVPAQAEIVLEGYVLTDEQRLEGPFGDHTGYYSMPDEYPGLPRHHHNPSPQSHLSRYRSGTAANGRLLDGQGDGTHFHADYQDDNAGNRRHEYAGRGHFPQPGSGVHQEGIPGPGAKGDVRAMGIGPDEPHQDHHRRGRFCGRAESIGSSVAGGQQHQPSQDIVIVEGPLDDLEVGSPTPKFGGKVGIDATRKGPLEGYHRGWPPDIEMSPDIKALVDSKWQEYGF